MSQINTAQLRKLWDQVQKKPEWATTKFWEYVFKQNVFGSHHWAIASQQPPTDDESDLRRVDLVVENIDDRGNSTTLLFMEAKRANATLDQIDDVEYQAFTACCAHLYYTGKPAIWAMTCVGSKARLWAYRLNDDYITAFWPSGDGLSERSEYAEFSTQGQEILRKLNFIKHNPIPSEDVFLRPPSPRPASATLPVGWHDNEVAFINASAGPSSISAFQPDPASQFQPESAYQGLVVDANIAVEVTVDKYENNNYKCTRASDDGRFYVSGDAWVECHVQMSGNLYAGYSWTADSGGQYYTWSLEPTRRPSKKRK
ncbi:hypothetical protein B0J13DRAFT_659937 [Dactylonectria estremocensis]|uniref:Uncharacterized protein n=1 Tax=Dactylonectria estremocensis TaxID=1079267 RepID=A0A9P9D2X9_9HYPO|nr:hypothetical protein B0J13DRAFT_659937 [Dactylonectria estremocensis]